MIGKAISHYRILELIGGGGMGVVYRAEDERLGRQVALKFLPEDVASDPTSVERFRREARAAAALNHPNICSIYDIDDYDGRPFIVMELLEGQTLQRRFETGPIGPDETRDIGIQLARGLEAAHSEGIIHRDIKPANIFITDGGVAKILDFGLAKWARPAEKQSGHDQTIDGTLGLTREGTTVGTIMYMSPEQALGRELDRRTDLFSLGAVLHEMATGQLASDGDTAAAVFDAILNAKPGAVSSINPDVPAGFDPIIGRLLEKDPERRYEKAYDLLDDLESLRHDKASGSVATACSTGCPPNCSTHSQSSTASIAVLPFTHMSSRRDEDYFCDGLAEELITALSKLEGLSVASRTSAFAFRDKAMDIRSIARELGVRTVLEGSVRKAGDRLRISAQLINASDGYHIWSERYDREIDDVFAIQDDIAQSIVANLRPRLLEESGPIVDCCTENPEAYNLYLKGRHFWHRRFHGVVDQAIEYFGKAIALDPNIAPAYAGLADCYLLLGNHSLNRPTSPI